MRAIVKYANNVLRTVLNNILLSEYEQNGNNSFVNDKIIISLRWQKSGRVHISIRNRDIADTSSRRISLARNKIHRALEANKDFKALYDCVLVHLYKYDRCIIAYMKRND